jgi:surfactin synthase thioesterase subunit
MKTQPFPRVGPTAVSSAFGTTVVPFRPRTARHAPPDSCLVRFHTRPEAQLRLFCFPWSGAGASAYRSHADAIPADIDMVGIQFPGRGTRRAEPARTELRPLARQIAQDIRADLDASPSRYAVLGHSYGSLLAYETVRQLQTAGLFPELAIMSGSRAPSVPPHTLLHRLDDAELARQLGRMGGLSPDRLHDPGFLDYLLPIVRSDLTACETAPPAAAPLHCPLTSWSADQDWYARPSDVTAWQQYAGSAYHHRDFTGDHFFINDIPAATAALLTDLNWARQQTESTYELAAA